MKAEIIKRIKGFIETQRYIGANEKLAVMRNRYSKAADEFYKEYGEIYYVNENGQSIGLNIKSIWHFVTLEEKIADLQSQLKERDEKIIKRWESLTQFADEYIQDPIKKTNLLHETIEQLEHRIKRYHGAIVRFTKVIDNLKP